MSIYRYISIYVQFLFIQIQSFGSGCLFVGLCLVLERVRVSCIYVFYLYRLQVFVVIGIQVVLGFYVCLYVFFFTVLFIVCFFLWFLLEFFIFCVDGIVRTFRSFVTSFSFSLFVGGIQGVVGFWFFLRLQFLLLGLVGEQGFLFYVVGVGRQVIVFFVEVFFFQFVFLCFRMFYFIVR